MRTWSSPLLGHGGSCRSSSSYRSVLTWHHDGSEQSSAHPYQPRERVRGSLRGSVRDRGDLGLGLDVSDQSEANGGGGRLPAICRAELAKEVRDVAFDGARTEEETLSDFQIGHVGA